MSFLSTEPPSEQSSVWIFPGKTKSTKRHFQDGCVHFIWKYLELVVDRYMLLLSCLSVINLCRWILCIAFCHHDMNFKDLIRASSCGYIDSENLILCSGCDSDYCSGSRFSWIITQPYLRFYSVPATVLNFSQRLSFNPHSKSSSELLFLSLFKKW